MSRQKYTIIPTSVRVAPGHLSTAPEEEMIAIHATDRRGRFTLPLSPLDAGVMGQLLLTFANDARARAGLPAL